MKMQKTKIFILAFVAWEWISSVTKSLFKLASYIVELPMVASGVYIMIATGIPSWNNPGLYNLSFGVLLSAPEILAPGAFFRAETMQSRGKLHAARVTRWIAGAMLFFSALTFSSVMIFHFPDQWLQAIMFCRVITALGYSIITRIDMDHDDGQHSHHVPPALLNLDSWSLVALAAHMQQETHRQLTELASEQKTAINLVDLACQRLFSEVQDLQEIPEPAVDYQKLALALGPLFEQRMNASVSAIKMTIIEEVKATLPMASEPPQLEARASSQSQQKRGSRATKKVDSEPGRGNGTKSPEDRLEAAFDWLMTNSIRVSGRALATRAHVGRGTANEWLQKRQEEAENGAGIVDSEPEE